MKENNIINALGQVDDKYIEEAVPGKKKSKKRVWKTWVASAACLVIIVGGVFALRGIHDNELYDGERYDSEINDELHTSGNFSAVADSVEETVAYGFEMDNCMYFPISFEERIRYGLVPEGDMGLTAENIYKITKEDLGEVMGEVKACGDSSLVGSTVYHFAKYPDYDSICIVEHNGEYSFYCTSGMFIEIEIGESSDTVLKAYGMPEAVDRISVRNSAWEELGVIDDAETIAAICRIVSGKENMGLVVHEKLFAKLWYDTYGNDDVYYDDAAGGMIYRELQDNPPEAVTYTDADGNEVTSYNYVTEDYDKAHALWSEGERVMIFTTASGFEVCMDYRPSVDAISFCNGYYLLGENEVNELNNLLGI